MKDTSTPKKKTTSFISLLIFLIAIVVVLALVFAFDIGGLRTAASGLIKGPEKPQPVLDDAEQNKIQREWDKLNAKEAELSKKESELKSKETDLKALEEETTKLNDEAKSLQAKLTAEAEDLSAITKLYEKMEPENAASILELLEDRQMAVAILKNMNADQAAQIVEQMQPEKAAEMTKMMLGGYSAVDNQ